MTAPQQPPLRTFAPNEYLEIERKASFKSEYLDGRIYDRSGGTAIHSLITTNTTCETRAKLQDTSCCIFDCGLHICTASGSLFAYPDVTVIRGEWHYHDDKRDVCTNPTVIVEVLSPSTEGYDRGLKWEQYQKIDSLQTYVLVAQHKPCVELFVRQANGDWSFSAVAGLDGSVYLASIDCTLALRDIYDRVEFPAAPSLPDVLNLPTS